VTERILLIEDDKRLAEMVTNYLGGFGFSVTPVHSGRSGIALYRREPFDALILDLMLPDMAASKSAASCAPTGAPGSSC
jgi:two-component system phosphate regulon response regulator OmpR